jgi:hypothetical protein
VLVRTTRAICTVIVSTALTTASVAQAAGGVTWGSLGSIAHGGAPGGPFLVKRPPKQAKPLITPESAEQKREAIRDAAESDLLSERWAAAAETLESNAAILGDPVTFIEAAEVRLRHAEREESIEEAERAIETTQVALDILYFYRSVAAGEAESRWLVIDPEATSPLIMRANEQIAAAEHLIETIRSDRADDGVAVAPDAPKRKDRSMAPGTGMIVGGSVAIAAGVAGVSMVIAGVAIGASKQSEVEDLDPAIDVEEIDRLDAEGARANTIAFVGTGLAVVGLAVGIPLLALGIKKRRGSDSRTAHMRVLPALGPQVQGLTLSGRF